MNDAIHSVSGILDRAARLWPDRPALSEPGQAASWQQLVRGADEIATRLRALGVRPGDRVAVVGENAIAVAAAIFATARVDAVAVSLNARLAPVELARVIDHADPAVVLYATASSPAASAHAEQAAAAPLPVGFAGLAALRRHPQTGSQDMRDVALLLYTTGTTGAPKGVMLTHANVVYAARAAADLRRMTESDRMYGALPMSHVFGLVSMLMVTAVAGSEALLRPRFSAADAFACLVDGLTVLPGVPQMHALIMSHAAQDGCDRLTGAALRYVSSGSAPLDIGWKQKAEAFYGVALQNGYGMTECTAGASSTANPVGSADGSVGLPFPDVEIRLGAVTAAEPGVGEVLIRGPNVMKGYFRAPEQTALVLDADGWLHSGDLGRFDAAGRLHIVGRAKELIIRGGFNVYPPEVEAALNLHPAVLQSAVVGRKGPTDEEVLAFVQLRPGSSATADDVLAFARNRLTAYKVPSRLLVCTELPSSAAGKILKHRLLDAFADRLARD